MVIRQSAEDYLETILVLHTRLGNVRSIDIAQELSVTKPSVSVAMKNLRTNGYILVDDLGYITLTDKGKEIADKIYERHTLLTGWLTSLGSTPRSPQRMPVGSNMLSVPKVFQPSKSMWLIRNKKRTSHVWCSFYFCFI